MAYLCIMLHDNLPDVASRRTYLIAVDLHLSVKFRIRPKSDYTGFVIEEPGVLEWLCTLGSYGDTTPKSYR